MRKSQTAKKKPKKTNTPQKQKKGKSKIKFPTSGCSRLRAQTSELAHVLAADPRRLAFNNLV
jgi:hypothetical protein